MRCPCSRETRGQGTSLELGAAGGEEGPRNRAVQGLELGWMEVIVAQGLRLTGSWGQGYGGGGGRVEAGWWLGGPSLHPERDGRPGLSGEVWLAVTA